MHLWVVEGEAGKVMAIEPSETERKVACGGRHCPQCFAAHLSCPDGHCPGYSDHQPVYRVRYPHTNQTSDQELGNAGKTYRGGQWSVLPTSAGLCLSHKGAVTGANHQRQMEHLS